MLRSTRSAVCGIPSLCVGLQACAEGACGQSSHGAGISPRTTPFALLWGMVVYAAARAAAVLLVIASALDARASSMISIKMGAGDTRFMNRVVNAPLPPFKI